MRFLLRLTAKLPNSVRQRLRGLNRLRWVHKLRTVRSYRDRSHGSRWDALRFIVADPELDNFTYDVANDDELATFVAEGLGIPSVEAARYIDEAQEDEELRRRLSDALRGRWDRKRRPLYGRRLGWYAVARALKPELIVETGIHDGLGSALLLRALERNAAEGKAGRLISVDIDPAAGWLVDASLRGRWQPLYESTFDALPRALDGERVGMIVHDSDHTYECENFEFRTAVEHAAPRLALISDNAHATSALRDVCRDLGIEYRFYGERPKKHFYPGAGIGFGYLDRAG